MLEILVIIGLCIGFAIVYPKNKWQAPQSTVADQKTLKAYERRHSIFVNRAELAFFKAINWPKPPGFHVFAKVRLEDILQVKPSIKNNKKHWQYRGRIKSRHVDFAVCNAVGEFICAIELDGSSHHSKRTDMTDQFKDGIFAQAGLPLYRVQTGENFAQVAANLWAELN